MKLGVVIVTYNRLELLKECVDACLSQTLKFNKIFIVNNASTDGTYEYLKNIRNKEIEVINSNENLGGAGGFYLGIKAVLKTDIDYLLIIDDDAIIDKNYNKNIFNSKYFSENIKAYSGTVYTDGKIIYEHRRFLKKEFKQIDSKKSDYEKEYFDYELSTFCGLYVSKKIIEKIGLPRRDFFIWYDDTEYSLRINKYSIIRNINLSKLNHKTKISLQSGYNWKSYYGVRNKLVILKEYCSKFEQLRYKLSIYVHIIGGKVLAKLKKNDYYNKVSKLYSDALNDAEKNNLGKNEKYTNCLVLKK